MTENRLDRARMFEMAAAAWENEHLPTFEVKGHADGKPKTWPSVPALLRETAARIRGQRPTIHALWNGKPMCNFSQVLPADWPTNHVWHGASEWPPPIDNIKAEDARLCESCERIMNLVHELRKAKYDPHFHVIEAGEDDAERTDA